MGRTHVPPTLAPPVAVMLARDSLTLPAPGSMPGGARYQVKWDGYRLVAVIDDPIVTLWSRRGTDLTAKLPEVADAVREQVPRGTVLDGEVVIWSNDRTSFELLASRVARSPNPAAVAEHPASYVVFDVLASAGRDIRQWTFDDRRGELERIGAHWRPPLVICPQTTDPLTAAGWFAELTVAGIEGLVVKAGAGRYRPAGRDWVKVKHRATREVVCGAYLGPAAAPSTLIVGLPTGEHLAVVGRTTPLQIEDARAVRQYLVPAGHEHPWQSSTRPGALRETAGTERLTLVDPFVIEVSADTAWTGRSYRHPLRFVRVRPDVHPDEVDPPPSR